MTILGAISLLIALQAQEATLDRDPGAILSKTMQRYWNAQSLAGTIVQTNSDGGGTLKITTKVSFERPGLIRVDQDYKGRNGLFMSLVSDGDKFAYDPPIKTPVRPKPKERIFEPIVVRRAGTTQVTILSVGDIYHAAHVSLMPSTLLDLAIAHKEHLKDFRINAKTFSLAGMVQINGKLAYKVAGVWQPYIGADDVQMRYELSVSTDFDLLQFKLTQPINVGGKIVQFTTTETADLKVGATVDRGLFVVR